MERRTASRMSLGNWSPLCSRCRCPGFPKLGWCARDRLFRQLSVETRFACCRPNYSQLLMGHTKQPVFAFALLVQLHGQPPELLLQSLRSRNVATLDPSRSSHQSLQIRYGDRQLPALCILHRSPLPSIQVLQLGPFFFPNRSGIKLFGSTSRTRDLISI